MGSKGLDPWQESFRGQSPLNKEYYMLKDYLKQINIEPTDKILSNFDKFSDMLIEWNQKINLTAITEKKEIEIKHFIDSLTIFKSGKINTDAKIIDVGCGAGFPSFPMKFAVDSLDVTLLDSLNKRVLFQNEVISELSLTKIEAIHSRAEDGGSNPDYREKFDIATARAVASLSSLIEICIPFVKTGGYFIAMKGPDISDEVNQAKNALNKLQAEIEDVISFDLPYTDNKRNLVIIKKLNATDKKYPRNSPKPIKQPL